MALLLAQRPDAYGLDEQHSGIVILPEEGETEEGVLAEIFHLLCADIGRRFSHRYTFRCATSDGNTAMFMKENNGDTQRQTIGAAAPLV